MTNMKDADMKTGCPPLFHPTGSDKSPDSFRSGLLKGVVAGIILLIMLVIIGRYNYLLFHLVAEIFSIAVAWALFMVVWNARQLIRNEALIFLGIMYFFIGFIDITHMLTYKGMNIFPEIHTANPATQLWIAGRFMESISLMVFPLLFGRKIRPGLVLGGSIAVTLLLLAAVFIWKIFPVCYVEGAGPTPFKRNAEYIISLILVAALLLLYNRRHFLDFHSWLMMSVAILSSVFMGISFTLYINLHELPNLIGHYFKIISFFFVYQALVCSGLTNPYRILFRNMKEKENRLEASEAIFRNFFENTGIYCYILSSDGIILDVNKAMLQVLGYSRNELVGQHVFTIYARDCQEKAQEIFSRWKKTGKVCSEEFVIQGKNGERRNVLLNGDAVRDPEGRILHSCSMQFDITDRKRTEQALLESEKNLREQKSFIDRVIESSLNGIYIYDVRERTNIFINPGYTRITGYTPDDLKAIRGDEFLECFHPDDREKVIAHMKDLLSIRENTILEIEYRFRCADGRWIWCFSRDAPFERDDTGRIVRLIGAFLDITERKKAEHAIRESEERLQALTSTTPTRIYEIDATGQITFANRACEDTCCNRTAGTSFSACFPDHIRDIIDSAVHDVFSQGEEAGFEIAIPDDQGEEHFYMIEISCPQVRGNMQYAVLTSTDITQVRRTEKALYEREEQYRAVVENLPDHITRYDMQFRHIYANRAALEFSGLSRADYILKTHREMGWPDDICERWEKNIQTVFDTGNPRKMEFDIEAFYSLKNFELQLHPEFDQNHMVKSVIGISRDISSRRRYEQEKRELETQLQHVQRMEALGTFAGGIAHDFNNILFPVLGFAEMLQEDIPPDSPLQESIEEIFIGIKRARDLARQILTFSRQANEETQPLKIQLVLKEIIKLSKSILPATISVKISIDPDCGLVMADPTQIHQVIMNLITNAYHAMEENGGILTLALRNVTVDSENPPPVANLEPGDYVCLTIADTGTGMDRATLEKIFEPYFTTKSVEKGTGLGLSVVHGIIKSCNGEIAVRSERGEGTVFDVYFPKYIQYDCADEGREAEYPVPTGTERILLVDDEEPVIKFEKLMLERLGYTVETRLSSVDALALFTARPNRFDLVITDMTMPNMTGDKLAQKILNIRPNIPVIICTGFSEKLSSRKLKQGGFVNVLMKPVLKPDMARMIRKVLDGIPAE